MKITRRDFSRKVAYYLDLIEQGEVIEVGDLQLCKLNTPKSGEFKERREEAILKTLELIPPRTLEARPNEVAMVMVKKHTIEPNCFIDEMNDWVPYPAHLVVKGVETKPYILQEEVKLETYNTGFVMNERATSMNDGSKPIPKPVKKKKKDL